MLAHMIASVDATGNLIIPSIDFDDFDEDKYGEVKKMFCHFAGDPKPYSVDGVSEVSKHGNVSGTVHKRLVQFWANYVAYYRSILDGTPAACDAMYACRYKEILSLDKKLNHEEDFFVPEGGLAADRLAWAGGVDASACSAFSDSTSV